MGVGLERVGCRRASRRAGGWRGALSDGGSGLGRHVGGEGGSGTVDDRATLKRHSTV
jgi:hypothetical protein